LSTGYVAIYGAHLFSDSLLPDEKLKRCLVAQTLEVGTQEGRFGRCS